VLSEIEANSRLRDITVIVFSSSILRHDREAMELGANDYLNKNGNFDALVAAAKLVCEKMTAAL
jgi:CheY-like chemotaxis protein